MNAAQALAIAAAAYVMSLEDPREPLELVQSGIELAADHIEALREHTFEGHFRAVPDAECMQRWAAM